MEKEISEIIELLKGPIEKLNSASQINDPKELKLIADTRAALTECVMVSGLKKFDVELNTPFVFCGNIHIEGKGIAVVGKENIRKFVNAARACNCFNATTDLGDNVFMDFSFVNITKDV